MLSRHWRLWLSFPSSPDSFSRRAVGNKLDSSYGLARPCKLGVSPIGLAVVTAADRAAAPCLLSSPAGGEGFQRAIAKPFGRLRRGEFPRVRRRGHPSHGRGGSVSRRDLNQAARTHAQLSGGTTFVEAALSNASCSSGGSAREGLLSEKPPPSHPPSSPTVSSEGARGRGFSAREAPPPEYLTPRNKPSIA